MLGTAEQLPPATHNEPPVSLAAPGPGLMKDDLRKRYADLFKRVTDLIASLGKVPAKIENDEQAGQVGDLMKAVRVCLANVESTRKAESEEWRRVVAEMNSTFANPADDLKKAREQVSARHDAYLLEKLDRERRALEEKAAREREAAEKSAREAAEAEQRRLDAQRRADEERAAAEAARLERERQDRLAKEAQERAERAAEEERQAIARKKAAEEAERAERKTEVGVMAEMLKTAEELAVRDVIGQLNGDEETNLELLTDTGGEIDLLMQRVRRSAELLDDALLRRAARIDEKRITIMTERAERITERQQKVQAAIMAADEEARRRQAEERVARIRAEDEARDAQRRRDEQAAADARAAREAAEAEAAIAKDAAKDARADQRAAEAEAKSADREAGKAGRDERAAMQTGERSDARAEKLERKAGGPEGDLVRTRGDYGSVGTLARRWTVRVTDVKALDLEKLRFHIHPDALQSAAQHFLDAGGRELPGAIIEQVTEGRVI